MFVSHIAPRMDRVVGANHPTPERNTNAPGRVRRAARRVNMWTLEAFNPIDGRR